MGNLTPRKIEPDFDTSAEEKISQLISAMPRVEAPGDFGFRVKARIAEARTVNSHPFWLPTALKAAVPLGLALAIGGYFAVTSLYIDEQPDATRARVETVRPGIVPSVPAAPIEQPFSPSEMTPAVINETKGTPVVPIRELAVKAQARKPVIRKPKVEDGPGSYDEAVKDTRNPVIGDPAVVKPEEVKGTPAGEVLMRIGVNALFGENGWKAESVSPNTAASRAGIKAGDIIESVDDQDMTDLGSVAKPAKGKKLKVKRDGKSVEIVID